VVPRQAVRDCSSRFASYSKIRDKIERHAEDQTDKLPVRLFVVTSEGLDKARLLLRALRRDLTVGQALAAVLPQYFGEGMDVFAATPLAAAFLHGVTPMASMPLRFAASNCSNPDLWVNLVVAVTGTPELRDRPKPFSLP
jgi:hypothetical protein